MKRLDLTNAEYRALTQLLWNSPETCSKGCVYDEMAKSEKDCDDCEFTHSIRSLEDKMGLNS